MTTAAQTTEIDTEPGKRRALLGLIRLADQEAQWLRSTDRDGNHITLPPESVRDRMDNRYYLEREWQLCSPLDLIAEAAAALRQAHDEFQRTQTIVVAWFERRRAIDAERDKKEHPNG